jgi:tetratricopeptide (TPR) repeat protein
VLACEASVSAAANKASEALELAELALFIAERVSGSDLWRARVQGYAWAFVGNARRVGNDLLGAERAFLTTRSLWEAGAAADPGVLDLSRVLDLEASLRRDQRQWGEALALLDQALDVSPNAERSGRILLKKASTHEQRGDCEKANRLEERGVRGLADRGRGRRRRALRRRGCGPGRRGSERAGRHAAVALLPPLVRAPVSFALQTVERVLSRDLAGDVVRCRPPASSSTWSTSEDLAASVRTIFCRPSRNRASS